jgi:hypothetical protein
MKRFFGLTVFGLAIAGAWCARANAASYQINTYANPRPSRISETRFFQKTGFLDRFSDTPVLGQVASPEDGEVSDGQPTPTLEELLKNWGNKEEENSEGEEIIPNNEPAPEIEEEPSSKKQVPEIEEHPRFSSVMEYAVEEKLSGRSMPAIMQAIADYFLGYPYQANLLDRNNEEKLVITLDGFDCVLFVETVLAIARGIAVEDYSYATFTENLSEQRYWKGERDGYCSRLHYFSEWISDNDKRGIVENIARDLGGVRINKTLDFMSRHRSSYPPMANNDANYQCIVNMEDSISRLKIDYIPYYAIRNVYAQLQPGDIVAVATEIEGLDVTHTGLVYRLPDGNIGLIHASPAGQVTIARDLHNYIWNVESAIGILVARPADPR